MSSRPPTPLNIDPPPVRTKFSSGRDDPSGSGISWSWIKFFQSLWTGLSTLSFQNISGKINISQINATGTPNASTFLRGDASWSPGAGGGGVTSVGMQGDGVVYETVVPGSPVLTAGTLSPQLASSFAGRFLATPAGSSGPWQARRIADTDLATAVFGGAGGMHSAGAVPDPGSVSGLDRVLFDNGTWGSVDISGANMSVSVNGAEYSDDYIFTINAEPQVKVNGAGV